MTFTDATRRPPQPCDSITWDGHIAGTDGGVQWRRNAWELALQ